MAEYLEQFERLSHGILLYNSHYNDTYFVTRFLDGLQDEIRAGIALHQPKDVLSASSLALLQEEAVEQAKKKNSSKDFQRPSFKPHGFSDIFKTPVIDKSAQTKHEPDRVDSDDKLKTLLAFRKKNGWCYKCGEKWGHGHKCPQQVSLHLVKELLDALEHEEPDVVDGDEETENDIVMAVGACEEENNETKW